MFQSYQDDRQAIIKGCVQWKNRLKILGNLLNSVPDPFQDISFGKGQHKISHHQRHHRNSQVNSHFQYRWSLDGQTFNIYFLSNFFFSYLTRKAFNNHILSKKKAMIRNYCNHIPHPTPQYQKGKDTYII